MCVCVCVCVCVDRPGPEAEDARGSKFHSRSLPAAGNVFSYYRMCSLTIECVLLL